MVLPLLLSPGIVIVCCHQEPYEAIATCYLDEGYVPYASAPSVPGQVPGGRTPVPPGGVEVLRLGFQRTGDRSAKAGDRKFRHLAGLRNFSRRTAFRYSGCRPRSFVQIAGRTF